MPSSFKSPLLELKMPARRGMSHTSGKKVNSKRISCTGMGIISMNSLPLLFSLFLADPCYQGVFQA